MSDQPRKIFVSHALPYANGSIHLGHMVGYTQSDIWVRFQRMRGHECHYVSATDAHGTPVMLRARDEGITPEALITRMQAEQAQDFVDFHVEFDNFTSTHADENKALVEQMYRALREAGHIESRVITQAYDEQEGMFLPDRYVRGTCPRCAAPDQYGDNCENCSATYDPLDLIDPISVVSGATPVARETEHLFFKLTHFEQVLRDWLANDTVDPGVANKLAEWFEDGLKDWNISRDEPYFGFRIPDTEDKYFYVWLDAPIGYLGSFKQLCDRKGLSFDEYWREDSDTEAYHFIGKDIVYFHCLFWPAVLKGAGMRLPTAVSTHGFLTYNKSKMSKSRGTLIGARTYLDHLRPEYLRYYFFAKLGPSIDNFDFNPDDFVARVNSDLIGKFVNIASRCAGFIHKMFDGELAPALHDEALFSAAVDAGDTIAAHYEARRFGQAARDIMAIADQANRYIDEHKPWTMVKDSEQRAAVQAICTQGLNQFRVLLVYLQPVMPKLVAQAATFLDTDCTTWDARCEPLLGTRIQRYEPLLQRIDSATLAKIVEIEREKFEALNPPTPETPALDIAPTIGIDDFTKIDLRVARIVKAQHVDGAKKLLQLTLDLGGEQRNVFAGIKKAYAPEDLEGRLTVMVANLAPRKMRFGMSEGMVLAASGDDDGVFILNPDSGAEPGMRVK
ncbi:MAG: methionine--tRNA ligase [Gammaproteobacteria bacterium]